MKKQIFLLFAAMLLSQAAFAYDFYATAPSGQRLYYLINNGTVQVTYPAAIYNTPWSDYSKPTGSLIIPDSVTHDGNTYAVTSIGNRAFYNCSNLPSVTIPNSVTHIMNTAFSDCSGLTSVTIGNSVTAIGQSAFKDCSGLTSVVFNADSCILTTDASVFTGCSNITNFTFGDNVRVIPAYLCKGLSITSVSIPNSVTYIGYCAFYGCSRLTSVTIGNSVSSIGGSAFYNCRSMTSVVFNADSCTLAGSGTARGFTGCSNITNFTIGDSVRVIPDYLCYGLSNLASVIIPNSVTSIGNYAFYNCSGLTSVTIPNSVTFIGDYAFNGCSGLTSVVFNADSCTLAGSGTARGFTGCSNITNFTFGDNVRVIPDYLCYGLYNLASVTIPNSVTSIGNSAFHNCSGLTSVTIGNSVTSIGKLAFYDCSGLTSVVFNAKNCTDAGYSSSTYEGTRYYYWPFKGCTNITNFTFGDNVKIIPDYLCYGLSNLTSVTIPNSVTSIGKYAFYQCSGLTSVSIGNSVTSIGSSAFSGCSGLTSVNYTGTVDKWHSITIGTGGNPISYSRNLYLNNVLLTNLVFSDTTTYINSNFAVDTALTSVTIPNSVTSIGEGAFRGCTGLTSVTIGNSVTNICNSAFYQCTGLTSVSIPNSVINIDNYAFYQCTGLTSLTIGNSVTSIGNRAFYQCGGLTSLTIPSSVTSIGSQAFYNCTLSSITFLRPTPPSLYSGFSSVFGSLVSNYVVYIPCGSWSQYATIISTPHMSQIFYEFSAVSADDSAGSVQITTVPTCTYPDAVISAVPADGYRFGHWSNGSTDNPYTLTVTSDTAIIAYFEEIPTYTVTVTADNLASGSVTGGGVFEEGSSITITATPANGYRFDHWSTGSTDNPYTFTITSDTAIIAYFEEIPTYTVTATADNPASGSVTGGGVFEEGSSITITATPTDGYRFDHWNTGSTDNPYTLTVTSDTAIIAYFEEIPTYTVTVTADNPASGSVTGGGVFEEGSSITITATPTDGYRFDHWSTGSTDNPYTFTVTIDTTIIAYFVSNGGTQGIGNVEGNDIKISVLDGHICVEGVGDEYVRVYDIAGRMVPNRSLPLGVYMVKVGALPARKVVVVR